MQLMRLFIKGKKINVIKSNIGYWQTILGLLL